MTALALDMSHPIPCDPLTPFDVLGGPPVGLALGEPIALVVDGGAVTITLDQNHIEQAYLQLVGHYQGEQHKPTRDRAKKSRDALKKRAWRVVSHAEGSHGSDATDASLGSVLLLPGSGSDTYAVDDQDCRVKGKHAAKGGPMYCPDSLFSTVRKAHRGDGEVYPVACYHTLAREILRIAVVIATREATARAAAAAATITPPTSLKRPTDVLDTDCALVRVAAPDLWAACFLMQRAGRAVTIRATAGDLTLSCGKRRVTLEGTGDGAGAVTVDAETYASLLLAPLKEHVKELGAVEVIIDLSGDEPVIAFSGTDFGCMAPATRLAR
ncbi:MAG TPA: hypothetical protein VNN10_11220 [Dehalococcoidia bacterium]|nr:hypothetical protein [Dehalococcoidia bacterium]